MSFEISALNLIEYLVHIDQDNENDKKKTSQVERET